MLELNIIIKGQGSSRASECMKSMTIKGNSNMFQNFSKTIPDGGVYDGIERWKRMSKKRGGRGK